MDTKRRIGRFLMVSFFAATSVIAVATCTNLKPVSNMGQRVYDKAYFYIRRNNRKRLRQLIRKHRYLQRSDEAFLILTAIRHNPGMLPWLLDRGVHPDSRLGKDGNTPLMQAAADGDLPTMRLLLAHGADPNARNEENELPLGFACSWEQWQAAKLLLENGAEVNGIEDDWGTHLECVERSQKIEGIELLRSYGGLPSAELDNHNGT